MLRPALEAAVHVARAGEGADPSLPAPPALRRFLNFARLPAPALDIARRVLDDDEPFRQRVAAMVHQSEVGEPGWLFLTRPDGWEERLADLVRQQQERDHSEREARNERDAQRRLGIAEERARRAEAAAAARAKEVELARRELSDERERRRQAEATIQSTLSDVDALRAQRLAAVRQLKQVEAELANRSADLRHARHEIRMREAEIQQMASRPGLVAPTQPQAPAGPEPDSLAEAIAAAAAAAEQLSHALAQASGLVAQASLAAAVAAPPAAGPQMRRPHSPRTPAALPPGVFDDSPEAAAHLVRLPGAVLVVDGYNVSQAAWAGRSIAEQRDRLVSALAELHARTGAEVELVFDGAEVPPGIPNRRPGVHVRFSPPETEADDVVVDLAGTSPPDRPLVVASSDNRVREGARAAGANVISAKQLLSALGR